MEEMGRGGVEETERKVEEQEKRKASHISFIMEFNTRSPRPLLESHCRHGAVGGTNYDAIHLSETVGSGATVSV